MKNNEFDLIHSLTKKAEALTVYDQYVQDAQSCSHCQDLWHQIKQDDRRHHDLLLEEVSRHAKEGKLS